MEDQSSLLRGSDRYQTIATLEKGSSGTVQLAVDKATSQCVAVKFIERGAQLNHKYVAAEVINHSRMMHPHIVELKDVFLTDTHLAIVTEYVEGGDLFSYVHTRGGLTEEEARYLFQQLLTALHYCHQLGVVHRDLKLENTLLDVNSRYARPILKLCDFGYSKNEPESKPKSAVGTPGYTAPEVLLSGGDNTFDGEPVDVWSAGVMLFAMLFGKLPFERKEDQNSPRRLMHLMNRILTADVSIPETTVVNGQPVSVGLKDLFNRIFVVDPKQRITLAQIQEHPWFTKNLPRSVHDMTQKCLQMSCSTETVPAEYVHAIVQRATQRPQLAPTEVHQNFDGSARGHSMDVDGAIDECFSPEAHCQLESMPPHSLPTVVTSRHSSAGCRASGSFTSLNSTSSTSTAVSSGSFDSFSTPSCVTSMRAVSNHHYSITRDQCRKQYCL